MAIASVLHAAMYPRGEQRPLVDTSNLQTFFSTAMAPFLEGLKKSRLLRAGEIAVLGACLSSLVPAALSMLMTAAVVSLVFCSLVLPAFKGWRKVEFELKAPIRLFRPRNYNEIVWEGSAPGKIYLGSLPNQLNGFGKHLVEERGVASVFSLNEPWERRPQLLSVPYTGADWQQLGVEYKEMDVIDHMPLTLDELGKAADHIHEAVSVGKNTYVHCRAGVGRSAMAVAAYLIKYMGKTAQTAIDIILKCRTTSNVRSRLGYLTAFEELVHPD